MKLKVILVSISAIFLVATFSTAYATDTLPTITAVCETKTGRLYAFDDGFSRKNKCNKKDRRVILIGQKGERGEQGIQGPPGEKGDKGEKGDPGEVDQAILDDIESRISELESSKPQEPLDVIFFNDVDISTTVSQRSDWYDSGSYSELVFTYQCKAYASTSEYGAEIILIVSNDKTNSATAFSASRAECHSGGSTTVDVAGKYYQVVVGRNTNLVDPPMTAYVAGRFR